ncbi:MAG: SOS response-associated peptidase [Rhodocyclaceae bacterium]|nr:SOS response-associated peptidase [Rhodocyclaceae bacterium]
MDCAGAGNALARHPLSIAMCGRYALYGPISRYRERFDAVASFDFGERYNIAPSSVVPVVRQAADGVRRFVLAKWGLVPAWVKDPQAVRHPINAVAETAAVKPMFRHAFRKGRVLVPADAFYEWKAVGGKKVPYLIRLRDQLPFGMAGLLEHWRTPAGDDLVTFTILTVAANALISPLHNRMPAIVRPEDFAAWLDPEMADVERLQAILAPYPDRLMEAFAISPRINSPRNDSADLLRPMDGEPNSA